MENLNKKREFLRWLITPQDEDEKQRFKENDLVDGYIELSNRIDEMDEEELTGEINNSLLLAHLALYYLRNEGLIDKNT